MTEIRFGTDGWRDRIGERFTVANVRHAALATAEHLQEEGGTTVVVGHDTRLGGPMFARAAAETMAAAGLTVLAFDAPVPTPVLSFAVRYLGAAGGVMVTASHNPAEWNGLKLKGRYGGTARDASYRAVARRLARTASRPAAALVPTSAAAPDVLRTSEVREAYFRHLAGVLDLQAFAYAASVPLVHDAMGGSAAGWLAGFARWAEMPQAVAGLRQRQNRNFYGVHPEPLPAAMRPLARRLQACSAGVGVATDGDGDRVGAVLPGGRVLSSHELFALLLHQRIRSGGRGRVVKSFTVSRLIERLAALHDLPVTETKVGFKWMVEEMLAGDAVLIAGEESGGFAVPEHLPERDGILNALLVWQAALTTMAAEPAATHHPNGPLGWRLAELEAAAGWQHAYDRADLPLPAGPDPAWWKRTLAERPPHRLAGCPVVSLEQRDGVKCNLEDGSWVLFRASGTEPLLRVYCEAHDAAQVAELLRAARAWVANVDAKIPATTP